ncbi:MAG: hypothetical protein SGI90_09980, partial [Candidatus Eisenbacteria bacterium]|nr:hypothetical protein [Candidatus Eisenbacteria bacterium]
RQPLSKGKKKGGVPEGNPALVLSTFGLKLLGSGGEFLPISTLPLADMGGVRDRLADLSEA